MAQDGKAVRSIPGLTPSPEPSERSPTSPETTTGAPPSDRPGPPPVPSSGPPPLAARVPDSFPGSPLEAQLAEAKRREPQSDPIPRGIAPTPPPPPPPPPLPNAAPPRRPVLPVTRAEPPGSEPQGRRPAHRRSAGPSRDRMAANDDRPSIGGLIYALNQRPSNRPFHVAAAASGVWAALALGFGWFLIAPEIAANKTWLEVLSSPGLLTALGTLTLPIALIWFIAMLAWRADDLRLRSSAMTEVAIRLAEPDQMAEQQVASLGQSVRRQVSFMNDAVSRAIGRAGELEALVHNEVMALERSYEENESKIRGLLHELISERSLLVSTGDKVSDTLRGLGQEIPELMQKLTDQQSKLAGIIDSAGRNLTSLESALGERTDRLEAALGDRTQHLQNVLEGYTTAVGAALGQRTETMRELFDQQMKQLDGSIGERTDQIRGVFEEYARALDTTLANRASTIDSQLVERTRALDNAFAERLKLFDESVLRSTMAVDSAVTQRAEALNTAMETHVRSIGDNLGKQAIQIDETLVNGITAVRRTSESITRQSLRAIEDLGRQADLLKDVSEKLFSQIHSVTGRFENQGQTILRAAGALESANSKIDATIGRRQQELSETLDRLALRADQLGETTAGYRTALEGSISEAEQRAKLLTTELKRTAEQSSLSTLAEVERLREAASGETDKAMTDIRSRFAAVTDEVSARLGAMSSHFDEASTQMRQRTQTAAQDLAAEQQRLRQQVDTLPTAARENVEAVRRSLKDQLAALEQLSSFTSREAQRRDVVPPVAGPAPPPAAPAPSSERPIPLQPAAVQPALQPAPQPAPLEPVPAPAPQMSAQARDERARALTSLSSSLLHELTQRQRTQPGGRPAATPPGMGPTAFERTPAPAPAQKPMPTPSATNPTTAFPPGVPLGVPPGGDGAAWSLNDLLSRASRPEATPSRGPSPGLEVEAMSRALDPATAAALWARLRAGQKGIMVRSIYTEEGRLLFDEVQRRIRGEEPYRRTVQSYLAEFEALLRQNDQRDPSGRLVESQLVAEAGRVYLFLAHAIGHIA